MLLIADDVVVCGGGCVVVAQYDGQKCHVVVGVILALLVVVSVTFWVGTKFFRPPSFFTCMCTDLMCVAAAKWPNNFCFVLDIKY